MQYEFYYLDVEHSDCLLIGRAQIGTTLEMGKRDGHLKRLPARCYLQFQPFQIDEQIV